MTKCTRCNAYKNEYNINCVPFSGNPNAEIYFLGEMAGKEEAEASKKKPSHFIGKAGYKFNELLKAPKIERANIAVANALRCYKAGNSTPTKKEMDSCFVFTWREIQQIKPKLIVAMGASALYQLTGKEGVDIHRGKLLWSDKVQAKVYVVYHPASCMYDPTKWGILVDDFKKIPSLLDEKPTKIKHYPYTYIATEDKFDEIFDDLVNKDSYFDVETTGLNPYKEDITLLQIGNGERIYIIDGRLLYKIKDKLALLFNTNKIIGQDFTFDAKFLSVKLDIFPKHWHHDTCLAEYLLTGMKDNDLDFLTSKYVPESFGYSDKINKAGGAHKVKDWDELLQYAADDIGVLFKIKRKQYRQLVKEGRAWFFDNILMPSNKVLTKMSLRGVKYDLDELMGVDKIYAKKAKRALVKALSLPGIKETEQHFKLAFNPRSYSQVKWLLLEYYKLPIIKKTKKGNPSVGKVEMERYAKEYKNPYCEIMEQYRSFQNIRDNFLSGVVPKLQDGVAHTSYSLHATNSGRPNSKDPNLLNIPREKDIKRCLIAREGCKFVCADEANLEVRIAGVVYREPKLIEISNDFSKDIHCAITSQAFNRDYQEIYDGYKAEDTEITELRVKGKSIQFAVIYQQQAQGLAYILNISEDEAQAFIDRYYKNFPALRRNIDKTKKLLVEQGYLDNFFGFRRRWKSHSEEDGASLREGVNHLVQSLAWNLLQLAMIELDMEIEKRGLEAKLLLQVYDSLVVETPDKEVDEVAKLLKYILENVNQQFEGLRDVLLKADVTVGKNLADVEKIGFTP